MFIVSAFILGLLVALNPCQLAINLSALTYLNNHSSPQTNLMSKGWLYVLGRSTTYAVLGIVLIILIMQGENIGWMQNVMDKGEIILPYLMIVIGIYLIVRIFHHHHHGENCHSCGKTIKKRGPFGAFILGMTLALAFCPETAIMYFGMLVPLGVPNTLGWIVPVMFAFGAALPILIMSYLMTKATEQALKFESRFRHFQQWANGFFGLLFVTAGIILFFL